MSLVVSGTQQKNSPGLPISFMSVVKAMRFLINRGIKEEDTYVYNIHDVVSCGVRDSLVWCPGQNKRITPLSFLHGCRKRRLKN
jgi:hypothetical protein